MLLVVQMLY